jgi:alpha/beta superfamily hydrolase
MNQRHSTHCKRDKNAVEQCLETNLCNKDYVTLKLLFRTSDVSSGNQVYRKIVINSSNIAKVVVFCGLLWGGVTAAIAANQRRLVFNPKVEQKRPKPGSSFHRTRPVVVRARDGTRLAGWLMTPIIAGRHQAVIYFGGRSEDVSWVTRDAGRIFPGMTVLAINYRGNGTSLGIPRERDLVDDGRVLFDWLTECNRDAPVKIAVVGRSLGSGVAVQVAIARAVHSLVLITPYDSILAIAKKRFRAVPVGFVLQHKFESVKYASLLTAPTYILRAAADDVVPHAHTDLLAAKLTHLYLDETIANSDHSTIPYLDTTQDKIANFLNAQFERHCAEEASLVA